MKPIKTSSKLDKHGKASRPSVLSSLTRYAVEAHPTALNAADSTADLNPQDRALMDSGNRIISKGSSAVPTKKRSAKEADLEDESQEAPAKRHADARTNPPETSMTVRRKTYTLATDEFVTRFHAINEPHDTEATEEADTPDEQQHTEASSGSDDDSDAESESESESESSSPSPTPAHSIPCLWAGCSEFVSSSVLRDANNAMQEHICEEHIGRWSQGNLDLACRWGACGRVFTKRDHITSHVKIHSEAKAERCAVCGKTFSRSQDRKKHEKVHD